MMLGVSLASGCQDDGGLLVPERGAIPQADARVADHDGKEVLIPFTGETVMLTLDASHSRDPEGRIAKYRWLSGAKAQPAVDTGSAGAAPASSRAVPANAEPDWPDDVERPDVELGEGSYAFTLWVIDERGLVSAPDVVRVEVARPLEPEVQACVEAVPAAAPATCARCVCSRDDACREAATASACADGCWNLALCIAQNCPGFQTGGDTSCVSARCGKYLPGSTFVNMLYDCVGHCGDACRAKL